MVNATVTAVEGYGPVTDIRLFLDLRSLDRNAAQHHADWFGQGKPDPGFQVPAPTMVTRVVGKVWERLTRPYWAYIHWRYPKLRGFPKPTLRERLQRAALPLRHVVAAMQYRLRWVQLEYGHHQPPRRDVAQMGARWRVRLRAAADQIEAGTPPDIRELRHLAKLAKEPVLGRRIARHIVRTALAELPRHHPQRHVLTAALAVSPPRRRVIPLHEKQKAWALAGWAFDHRSIRRLSGARAHDIGPPLLAFVYLHAVYGWPYWCRVAGFDRQGLNRECLRALLVVHLGQPDKGRWLFSATAAERMRKIAALRC